MFTKKYSPSIKANNQLRDKVVAEINSFIYRLERGRYSSESDHEAILRIIEDLKADVEILSNTVGTGEENIGALADGILDLLKDLLHNFVVHIILLTAVPGRRALPSLLLWILQWRRWLWHDRRRRI